MDRTVVSGNRVDAGAETSLAGGMYLQGLAISMRASAIVDNQAAYNGGLWLGEGSAVEITNVTIAGNAAVATEALTSFGAAFVRPVVTSPGAAGTLHARVTERSNQLLAMLPNDALRFVVAQPWVVRLDGANSWPSGPELPADVEHRLDPELRSALRTLGRERPYAVGGIAETRGCLDDVQREKLVELGAIVGSVIAHPSCTQSIVTIEIPLSRLVALASLPWIVQLEGSRPMHPEDIGEPDHD
jgi:hypothetical protein